MAASRKKLIDRTPPETTGNTAQDLRAMQDYLNYLREQINFILTLIYREREE